MVRNLPALQETLVQSLGWEDTLEEGMATHSSILAWRIPWTEKPGGLQSMGSERVGHDWATNTATTTCAEYAHPSEACRNAVPLQREFSAQSVIVFKSTCSWGSLVLVLSIALWVYFFPTCVTKETSYLTSMYPTSSTETNTGWLYRHFCSKQRSKESLVHNIQKVLGVSWLSLKAQGLMVLGSALWVLVLSFESSSL